MTEQRVSYTLDSTLETVDSAEQAASRIATEAGFDDEEVMQIAMAVREAAVNAVLHGNAYDPGKKVRLDFEQTGSDLVITIRDQGKGLDLDKIPDPLAPENLLKTSGRGIFLIRSFMDEVQINPSTDGHRNQTNQARPRHSRGRQGGFPVSMKTSTRQVDGVTIVDCSGRITLGEGSVILRDTVRDLLSKGQKKILLNLGDVNYIDSSGIGELVSAFTTVRNQGGELKLLNLTKKVHDLLQITKLYTVFDVKDDEAAAVKSFSK